MSETTKVSFVVTSRNDGSTGEELRRLQIFVSSLIEQCERFRLEAELVLVEWNPPADTLPLAKAITWPKPSAACPVRIIRVPKELHDRFKNSDAIPLFQMIAKNVGIRRARGQFVLATNVDILFSNELMQFLASGKMSADRMYRIDRYDARAEIPDRLTADERLAWCRDNMLRVYRYLETVDVKNGVIPPPKPGLPILKRIKNWLRGHQYPLHTNACGDFTMLSAEYWEKVAGHPEFPLRAMKLDGLLCYAAHYAGARENVLKDPMRIYHLEHPARSDGAIIALSRRETDSRDLQLPFVQYRTWVEQMQKSRQPVVFNDSSWGLAGEELVENVIGQEG